MEEQLVSFETAKLAKEKGFDYKTSYGYHNDEELTEHSILQNQGDYMWSDELETEIYYIEEYSPNCKAWDWNRSNYYTSAPTQSLLQKWLREKHELFITIESMWDYTTNCHATVSTMRTDLKQQPVCNIIFFETKDCVEYEPVLEEALYEALKLI